MRIAVLAIALLAPIAARAAEAQSAAAPPRWSIGAGVGGVVFGDQLFFGLSPSSSIPFARASLERRVGHATWLVLGVVGSYEDNDSDPQRAGSILIASSADDATGWRGRVEAGLRRELTGAAAPFVVSGLLLANVGGISLERTFLTGSPAEEVREDWDAVAAGVSAGLAVDRELTPGLSVRISSSLVTADWSWGEITAPGAPAREFRRFRVGVVIAPVLELRLAF